MLNDEVTDVMEGFFLVSQLEISKLSLSNILLLLGFKELHSVE